MFFADNIMEQNDAIEESSPKPDDGNGRNESVIHDGDDETSSSNPQAETTQEEAVTNQGGTEVISPKPNKESADGESSVLLEGGPSNPDASQVNDDLLSEGQAENKNTDGVVAAENEQNVLDPVQEDIVENGIVWKF